MSFSNVCEKSSQSTQIHSAALRDEKNCKFVSYNDKEIK